MKSSDFDLREEAFSTRSRILDTVLSPNSLVVRSFSTPVMLMQPEMISSPSPTSRGRDSPVRAAVFRAELPSVTTPSMGTFSPGWTTMTVPTRHLVRVHPLQSAVLLDVGVVPGGCP